MIWNMIKCCRIQITPGRNISLYVDIYKKKNNMQNNNTLLLKQNNNSMLLEKIIKQFLLTEQTKPSYSELDNNQKNSWAFYWQDKPGVNTAYGSNDAWIQYPKLSTNWWNSLSDEEKKKTGAASIKTDDSGKDVRLSVINDITGKPFTKADIEKIETDSNFKTNSFDPTGPNSKLPRPLGKCKDGYEKDDDNDPRSACVPAGTGDVDDILKLPKDVADWWNTPGEPYFNGWTKWEIFTGCAIIIAFAAAAGAVAGMFKKILNIIPSWAIKAVTAALKTGARWIGIVIKELCAKLKINIAGRFRNKKLSILNEMAMKLARVNGEVAKDLKSGANMLVFDAQTAGRKKLGAALEQFAKIAKSPAIALRGEEMLAVYVKEGWKSKTLHPEYIANIMGGNYVRTPTYKQMWGQYLKDPSLWKNSLRSLDISKQGVKNIQTIGNRAEKQATKAAKKTNP